MHKGYIFDLDGTLSLTQGMSFKAFKAIFDKFNLSYSLHDDEYLYSGRGSKEIIPAVFKANGKEISAEDVEKLALEKRAVYDHLLKTTKIYAVNGAYEFLQKAQLAGIKIILATGNKDREAREILQKINLSDFFPTIISQKDVINQKPAPDIFLLAASKLQIPLENCIVFEDSLNGVLAAKSANIECIALTTGIPADMLIKQGASKTIKDYNQLRELP